MGSGKNRWKIFHRSSSPTSSSPKNETKQPQKEFLCPISGTLMSDPVIVSSGQTFERLYVQVCKDLDFNPTLQDGSKPDFSTVIPNLALKSTILTWCSTHGIPNPSPPEYLTVEKIVRTLIASSPSLEETSSQIGVSERELLERVPEKPQVIFSHAATELGHRVNHFSSGSSSEESVIANIPQTPVHLFTTRPSCYSSSASSSSSSSSLEIVNDETLTSAQNPNSNSEEGEIWANLKSPDVFMQEEGVIELRKITRNREETRVSLCTPRILSALRSLILSRYVKVQSNAVAAVVNLSLEKLNKVKIVRSGMVPPLIDALKGGFPETQEHVSGALFSLALEDDNKTAIGVLGALPPLLHALRSEIERTRHDSALALYHLTLVHSNRIKLVKLNVIPSLLTLTKSNADMAGRTILILCNLAACPEGKSAILDSNGVECLVTMLRNGVTTLSKSTMENCVVALYSLSIGSLRFKGLAKEAGAAEVLHAVEAAGSERAREKAKRMLQMMRERGGEDGNGEEVDWEEVLNSDGLSRTRCRFGAGLGGGGKNVNAANSTDF